MSVVNLLSVLYAKVDIIQREIKYFYGFYKCADKKK